MDPRIEKAYDIIKRNFQRKMLLSDLATKVELSPYHFQRLFRKEMNESPANCLARVRLERAAHFLITAKDVSMSTLAEECGFSSLSTFSRAFSKRYGMSPIAFKNDESVRTTVVIRKQELKVELVYVEGFQVYYRQTALLGTEIINECTAAERDCKRRGISTDGRKIGILTYLAFHYPQDPLNYYAGVGLLNKGLNDDQVFTIPAGKYACIDTTESVHECRELLMQFKADWMDRMGYGMRDLFSFDVFDSNIQDADYPRLKRKIFIPVKKIHS
jgi:AraC-like DNA-binding protein/predicted transcriptional regulator YdeE